jgi:hypothetical protein
MKPFVFPKKTGIFFFLMLFIGLTGTWAQKDSSEGTDKASYFKVSGNYLTNSVYYGRKDSLPMPYLTASAGYYDKSGFYISGSISYLSGKNGTRIDYSALDLGYNFTALEHFSGAVYGNKSWYNQSSTTITSDIKGSIGSLLSYDLNAVQLNGGIDLTFANKTDIGFNLGLSHDFIFGKTGDQFSIEPSFMANWSSLHSYEGYINRKLGKKAGIGLPPVTAVTAVQNNKITLLDYEIWVPFIYEKKKIGFMFTPTLAIPQNPIYTTTTVTTRFNNGTQSSVTNNSTPQSEKKLSNNFYAEFEVFFKF